MSTENLIDPARQARLKDIIARLHAGRPVSEVKKEFASLIQGVSAAEVAAMEQALIDGGMPVEEVQRLCDVHVQVFESSLSRGAKPSGMPGHPIHTMLAENRLAGEKAHALGRKARAWAWNLGNREEAAAALADLSKITVHYARKENQLFPYLEKQSFTGPSRVMWGKHDEIRAAFREAEASLEAGPKKFRAAARALRAKILGMIFMEERILLPEAVRRLSEAEWAEIRLGEDAIGFSWVKPESMYDAPLVLARSGPTAPLEQPRAASIGQGGLAEKTDPADLIALATGLLPKATLDAALRILPIDISIVGPDDKVLYYSDSPERIFPRSPAVIGRTVQNCHPQQSVHIVERILQAFKRGEKDKARFWLELHGRFVVIEYYALRSAQGDYLGTLEVSQDVTGLRALEGQNRLLDWE
jgi:uncharacterized protein